MMEAKPKTPRWLLTLLSTLFILSGLTACSSTEDSIDDSTKPMPEKPVAEDDWQTVPVSGGTITKDSISITFPSGTFSKETKVAITDIKHGEMCGEYEASKFYQITMPMKIDKELTLSILCKENAKDIRFVVFSSAKDESTGKETTASFSLLGTYYNGEYKMTIPATNNDEDDGNGFFVIGLVNTSSVSEASTRGTRGDIEGKVGNISWYYDDYSIMWLSKSLKTEVFGLEGKLNKCISEAIKQIHSLGFSIKTHIDKPRQIPIRFYNDPSKWDQNGLFDQSMICDEWSSVKLNLAALVPKKDDDSFLGRVAIHELFHYFQAEYDPRSPCKKSTTTGEHNVLCEAGSVWIEQFVNGGNLDAQFLTNYIPYYRNSLYNIEEAWKMDSEHNKDPHKRWAAHGYAMSTLLHYITSPVSNMKENYGIDKMKVLDLFKKWKTFPTLTFDPLESWLRDHNAWISFTSHIWDEYMVALCSGKVVPEFNEADVMNNTGGRYKKNIQSNSKVESTESILTYGCDVFQCNISGYKNEKGENSFDGKEIVIKQLSPDVRTYVVAKGKTAYKQIGTALEKGDSLVIAGEKIKGLAGNEDAKLFNLITLNHMPTTSKNNVTFEIRDAKKEEFPDKVKSLTVWYDVYTNNHSDDAFPRENNTTIKFEASNLQVTKSGKTLSISGNMSDKYKHSETDITATISLNVNYGSGSWSDITDVNITAAFSNSLWKEKDEVSASKLTLNGLEYGYGYKWETKGDNITKFVHTHNESGNDYTEYIKTEENNYNFVRIYIDFTN